MITQKMQCLFLDLLDYFCHVLVERRAAPRFQYDGDVLLSGHIPAGHDQTKSGSISGAGLSAEDLQALRGLPLSGQIPVPALPLLRDGSTVAVHIVRRVRRTSGHLTELREL